MTQRALKVELRLLVILGPASALVLGVLLFAVWRGFFPEILIPFVERLYGTKENAAIAADLGMKLGIASGVGLLFSVAGFVHYLSARKKVRNGPS